MKKWVIFKFFDFFYSFLNSTPNVVTTKEHSDNSNVNASEFNPAYSVEITNAKTQGEVDTFDHILQVTSHHEAVVAYYYMDDDNKVLDLRKFCTFKQLFSCISKVKKKKFFSG